MSCTSASASEGIRPQSVNELAAKAAENRQRETEKKGIGDSEKVKRMQENTARGQETREELFGVRRRWELREALNRHKKRAKNEGMTSVVDNTLEVPLNIPSTALEQTECTCESHICGSPNHTRGCSSCGLTCHSDCRNWLCPHMPCGMCLSQDVVTHEDSEQCREEQFQRVGCHECGRPGCYASAPKCHAKCTRFHHVCETNKGQGGCMSCDKTCHANNQDPRCAFFQRDRGVEWEASQEDLRDTLSGTAGALPHRTQVSWDWIEFKKTLRVDGEVYTVGLGFPGNSWQGEWNNCLIDSLRQCLGNLECDRRLVRQDLIARFGDVPDTDQRLKVSERSFLDIENHWREILCSLFRHNRSGKSTKCDPNEYCILALYSSQTGRHGTVVGSSAAKYRLVIINWDDVHFDPCLQQN